MPTLFAVSDLHVRHPENRRQVEQMAPASVDDWLIVAGDLGEVFADVEWALRRLRERFASVIWAPGNHELWTTPTDPVRLRGQARYDALVEMCRRLGVATPEDPYPVWDNRIVIAPLFVLYDYTFRPAGCATKEDGLARAYAAGVVCTDELLLHPDPWPTRDDWCRGRIARTEQRLAQRPGRLPTVLVNHFPLVRAPTDVLRHPEFAQWCGTVATADRHRRFDARAVVYGHLHIPRSTVYDGIPFEEVSLGYPREWRPPRHAAGHSGDPRLIRRTVGFGPAVALMAATFVRAQPPATPPKPGYQGGRGRSTSRARHGDRSGARRTGRRGIRGRAGRGT
jgi:3',5'-cyclic AMP phosphodiesterase CpdA